MTWTILQPTWISLHDVAQFAVAALEVPHAANAVIKLGGPEALSPLNVPVPSDLPHAMIFFTAGEAVRRVDPSYVPYADAFEVWPQQLSVAPLPAQRLKPLLEEIWKPYLDGQGARDEALAVLVTSAVAVSRP